MKQMIKTRFAPSPSGRMHLGNLRTALFNYLFATQHQGQFVLRFEDTDQARSTQDLADDLLAELDWCGLKFTDAPMYQSKRHAIYQEYLKKLDDLGHVYPCYCSHERLEELKAKQIKAKQASRYDNRCRNLLPGQIAKLEEEGHAAVLRFKVPMQGKIEFTDLVKGPQSFAANHLGDFILRRADQSVTFLFSNALDDALMNISHAFRGMDHLSNTPKQILLLQALGLQMPLYGHLPMINGDDGCKLSKRNGSRSLQSLQAEGYQALAIHNYLGHLGHHYLSEEFRSLAKLAEDFKLEHIAPASAKFDLAQLQFRQKEAMHALEFESYWTLIKGFANPVQSENALAWVDALQANLILPSEAAYWLQEFGQDLTFSQEALAQLSNSPKLIFKLALEALSVEHLEYKTLVLNLKEASKLRGRELFHPLRLALSGRDTGPEMAKLYALLSKQQIMQRLQEAHDA